MSIKKDRQKAEKLKILWRELWTDQLIDKQHAEEMASREFSDLFIERGTVLRGPGNCVNLTLTDVLKKHQLSSNLLPAHPSIGGYNLFIKNSIRSKRLSHVDTLKSSNEYSKVAKPRQLKKNGKGWIHFE